jgi:hypothetical protein
MLTSLTATQLCVSLLLLGACTRTPAIEQKVIGAWSWTYIEGTGRMIFSGAHTVKVGFPPDDKDGRKIDDSEFEIVQAGTWRLEGDVLVTETDNQPLRKILERLSPNEVPALEKKTERKKIISIDDKTMKFGDGSSLDRVRQ